VIVDDYFSAIERSLRQSTRVGTIEDISCLASDDYNGLIRCRVFFWDDSYLDIYEVVSTELGYPVRVHYAYTYIREAPTSRAKAKTARTVRHKQSSMAEPFAQASGFSYHCDQTKGEKTMDFTKAELYMLLNLHPDKPLWLPGADLSGAQLWGANLRGAALIRANLSGATLVVCQTWFDG
jgi:hypothetical protein